MLHYYIERSFTQVILLKDITQHIELLHSIYLLSEHITKGDILLIF